MKLAGLVAGLLMTAVHGPAVALAIILNSNDDSISLVDRTTYTEKSRFVLGRGAHHLMATPDERFLIVANTISNELVFLDPKTGEFKHRIRQIADPYQIGFSPDRKWFVSNSLRLDRVDIYRADDFKLAKRLPVPSMPSHMAFNRDSTMVFITLQQTNRVAFIDLVKQELVGHVEVGKQPAGIHMTPDDKHLLVGVMGADHAAVIDWRAAKLVKIIPTGKGAHNLLPVGDGRHVLITNRVANTISMIDQQTLSVVDTFPAPGGPDCMEITRDGKELWVTARWARQVNVLDMATRKIKYSIPVGRSPHGLYIHDHAARM